MANISEVCWCRKKVARSRVHIRVYRNIIHRLRVQLLKVFFCKQYELILLRSTSIKHLICDHDTSSLHYNGAVLMLEGDWFAMDATWYFCSLGPHLEKTIKMITYDDQTSHAVSTTPVLRVCTCHVIKKL